MTLVYEDKGKTLNVGDSVILKDPGGSFHQSNIGKVFAKGVCDTCVLEVKQRAWLEVYFYLTLYKDGNLLTNCEVDQEKTGDAYDDEAWYSHADYSFMRYILGKEGSVIKRG